MVDQVLIIRSDTGSVKFDSRLAVGGVCLGLYTVASGGSVFAFNGMGPGLQGVALNLAGKGVPAAAYTYDNSLGHPRFTFAGGASGMTVALFVK